MKLAGRPNDMLVLRQFGSLCVKMAIINQLLEQTGDLMPKYLFISLISLYFLMIPISRANDGAAGLDGGDLKFKDLKGVEMLRELLYLSPDEVRVSYVFKNKTARDITTLISFPIRMELDGGDLAYDSQSKNPMGFSVKVNGKPKSFATKIQDDQRNNADISTRHLHHYWRQTFPKNAQVKIEHSYKPVYSIGVAHSIIHRFSREGVSEMWDEVFGDPLKKEFCATHQQVELMKKKRLNFVALNYILTTARTWDGPIGHFELILDKGKQPFLFLCTDLHLEKIAGKNQFRAVKKNYIPKENLSVAFMGKWKG